MKRISRFIVIIGAIAFSLVIISILAFYSFMPVWVYVEKGRLDVIESAGVWRQISDEQLDQMPLLKTAIEKADQLGPSPNPDYSYIMGSNSGGDKISHQLNISGDARLHLIYNDGKYLLHIVHSYSQPSLDYVPPMPIS